MKQLNTQLLMSETPLSKQASESNRLIRGQEKMAASPFTSYHYPYVDRREERRKLVSITQTVPVPRPSLILSAVAGVVRW